MNKKLQKGLTVTASMAMAMGVGIPVTTVLAAPATTAATTTVAPASAYGVMYRAQVQTSGWEQTYAANGTNAGTIGLGKRLEAVQIKSDSTLPAGAHIQYEVHVQSTGWNQGPVVDGATAGTVGQSKRLEAIRIKLVGMPGYSVRYKVQVQTTGWTGWSYDGADAGTTGQSKRLETLEVQIVKTDAENTAEINAIDAVTNAETTKTTADVATAKTATDKVLDATEKAVLTARIANIDVSLAVSSVSAINATQVNIAFSKAVNPASLFTDGKSGAFKATVTFVTIDGHTAGNLTGVLSADGKTLTVTSANVLLNRYDVVVDNLLGVDGTSLVKYSQMDTIAADTTVPTIVSTTKISASTFKVSFSEPLKTLGTVSYKLADGTVVYGNAAGVTNDFATGNCDVTFTLGTGIAAGQVATATFIGAQDQAGNLLTPNPATASFAKGDKDGVAPKVSSITQTGAMTFAVKYSEAILSAPTVSIGGNAIDSSKIVQDTTDPTIYNVTAPAVLNGATDVATGTVTDLSGEVATASSKVVTFVKDATAPTVVSSVVSVDATTGKEYLDTTFNENVNLTSPTVTATGSSVKNYITTPLSAVTTPVAYKTATNKTIVRVALASLLVNQDVSAATYNLNLSFAGIASEAGIAATTATTTFARGIDGVAANATVLAAPVVTQGADNNKVNVTFTGAIDGSSATNVSNYNVDGAIVKSVTLEPLSNGTQIAVLNLVSGSNTFTGVRNISVANVMALGSSKAMVPYTTNLVPLNENVVPVITSAKLTATNKITLTFSEAVTDGVGADFEVLVGGKSYATPEDISVNAAGTTTATVTLTTAADATALSSGISLKALTTLDEADSVGNVLSVPANITVTQ